MFEHPISDLFKVSLDSIKEMIDVNTVIGSSCKLSEEVSVIPISKVKTQFLTGGLDQKVDGIKNDTLYPFGGATGGMVNITPIAFLVLEKNSVKILHLEDSIHLFEKLIDNVPEAVDKIKNLFLKSDSTIKTSI